jgi:hypothetical protein
MMIMNIAVNVALVINNQVNPIPMDGAWKGSEWKLYCCYTCWIAVELTFVYFFYVETKYVVPLPYSVNVMSARNFSLTFSLHRGPTLEEIARIFDGDNAEVGIAHIKDHPELSNERGYDEKRLGSDAVEQHETMSHKM